MTVEVFQTNDNDYRTWMDNNPSYFVVNTQRATNSDYYVLHKSKCRNIYTPEGLKPGAYTTRNNIKVCSGDLNGLKSWFYKERRKFKGVFRECQSCKPFIERFIDNPTFLFPDFIETEELLYEGAKTQVIVNAYERNLKARQECLDKYGYSCSVCHIDFEKVYGIIGKDFIHVHHLKELSQIGAKYEIKPTDDLRPVCPNCHAMLHQRKPCFTIQELTGIMINSYQHELCKERNF